MSKTGSKKSGLLFSRELKYPPLNFLKEKPSNPPKRFK